MTKHEQSAPLLEQPPQSYGAGGLSQVSALATSCATSRSSDTGTAGWGAAAGIVACAGSWPALTTTDGPPRPPAALRIAPTPIDASATGTSSATAASMQTASTKRPGPAPSKSPALNDPVMTVVQCGYSRRPPVLS